MVPFPAHARRAEMKRDIAAYRHLHSELVKQYLGHYVGIFRGKFVDHDEDPVALHYRVVADYLGEIALSREIDLEADAMLHMRSPGLEKS